MNKSINPADRPELFDLYSQLHLAAGRAAAALRLADRWDAPEDQLLAWFDLEEERVASIWQRILGLRRNEETD
jgi:hypothetical protein